MSASAEPSWHLHPRSGLRGWTVRRLANRLSLGAGALTLALLGLALAAGLLLSRWTAETYTASVLDWRATQASQSVANTLGGIEDGIVALAHSSFVVNALTDSGGRDAYLSPFLRQHPLRAAGVELRVCDGANRPIGTDDSAGRLPAAGPCASEDEARRVLGDGLALATVVDGNRLRWLVPVRFPLTGTYEGLVAASVPLAMLTRDDTAVLAGGGAWPAAGDGTLRERTILLPPESAAAVLPLVVRVTLPPGTGRLPFAPIVLGYGCVGLVLLVLTVASVRRLAARIVAPLNDLAALSHRAGDGAPVVLPPALDRPDEVGELARALAQMAGTLHDTNRRLAEQVDALTEARNQAQAASVAKSEFLAVMTHEIRTPMNAVLGMLYLTLQAPLAPRQRDQIERAQRAAQALLRVINDVLDFSKADAGRIAIEPAPFRVAELLAGVADTVEIAAEQKGLQFETVLDTRLPAVLRGDAGRLRQVLVNLVGNAVKFTVRGKVVLRLEAGASDGQGCELVASVQDTGIGLAPHEIERLFQPFSQVDSSAARRHEGSGLGLAISQRLVAAMGGTLAVKSAQGVGSCFGFRVRLAPVAEAPTAPATAAPAVRPQRVPELVGCTVLIVDDNEANRLVARGMLQLLGPRSLQAADGHEALAMLADGAPVDAVLLDVRMPGMDGYETARRMRADARWHSLPVIAMTADPDEREREACFDAGMDEHLAKPLSLDDLREHLLPRLLRGTALAAA